LAVFVAAFDLEGRVETPQRKFLGNCRCGFVEVSVKDGANSLVQIAL
jgi:hypothetical protein